jgi:hypothetical protein
MFDTFPKIPYENSVRRLKCQSRNESGMKVYMKLIMVEELE